MADRFAVISTYRIGARIFSRPCSNPSYVIVSQSELYGNAETEPFLLAIEKLNERKSNRESCNSSKMYEKIWHGGMPGHRSGKYKDRDIFYSSYVQSYINRDVADMIPGIDKLIFSDFIRATACRAGHMLNAHEIAKDIGVSDDTVKRWL